MSLTNRVVSLARGAARPNISFSAIFEVQVESQMRDAAVRRKRKLGKAVGAQEMEEERVGVR